MQQHTFRVDFQIHTLENACPASLLVSNCDLIYSDKEPHPDAGASLEDDGDDPSRHAAAIAVEVY